MSNGDEDGDDFFFSDEFLANVEVPLPNLQLNNSNNIINSSSTINNSNIKKSPTVIVPPTLVNKPSQPVVVVVPPKQQHKPVVVVVQKKQSHKVITPLVQQQRQSQQQKPQLIVVKKSSPILVNQMSTNKSSQLLQLPQPQPPPLQQQQQQQQPRLTVVSPPPPPLSRKPVVIVTPLARPQPPPAQQHNQQQQQQQQRPIIPIAKGRGNANSGGSCGIVVVPPIQKVQQQQQQQQQQRTSPLQHAQAPAQSPGKNTMPDVLEFTLLSKDSFRVSKTGSRAAAAAFQMCGGAMNPQTGEWTFPLTEYNNLVANLGAIRSLRMRQLPQCVVNMFLTATPQDVAAAAADSEMNKRVHPKILRSLMDFQRVGVRFGISNGGRCLIADEMGLGKTIQALALVSCYKEEWPFLVVTPSSLKIQWAECIEEWLEINAPDINIVSSGSRCDLSRGKAVIVSYDLVIRLKDKLAKTNFRVVVADESHMFKNRTSKRATTLVPVLKAAKRAILLSGTPALSRPVELYSQIDAINPALFPNFREFGIRYCGGYKVDTHTHTQIQHSHFFFHTYHFLFITFCTFFF